MNQYGGFFLCLDNQRRCDICMLRTRVRTTYHFGISASGHLLPILIRKILEIAGYSCGFARSDQRKLTQI